VQEAFAFGPVPSRRLGRSLGINNIPPKTCSYSCVYCQLGSAVSVTTERQAHYAPEAIAAAVRDRVVRARAEGEAIDYLTFVPDGEPTLDANLGRAIRQLRPLGIAIAVITNGSLLWREEVRADLSMADWVSLKVDAVSERVWRRLNRPHRGLSLAAIAAGMLAFREQFQGCLATETMLVQGVNDSDDELQALAAYLASLRPDTAYIAIPTRPPAADWVAPVSEAVLQRAYHAFAERGVPAEFLIGYEGDAFAASGDAKADLLSITAVHPMREDGVRDLLLRDNADWRTVAELIDSGDLIELDYRQQRFYMRRLPSRARVEQP